MKLEVIKDIIGQPYVALVFSHTKQNSGFICYRLNQLRNYIIRLYGDDIFYKLLIKNKDERDGKDHWHITVFNSMECKKFPYLLMLEGVEITTKNYCEGIGTIFRDDMQTFFIVVENKELTDLMNIHQLKEKHFHITLGFNPKDLFHSPKNNESLIIY